jgi:two-component system, OmpR family, response regulator
MDIAKGDATMARHLAVVEEDPGFRESCREILAQEGFVVSTYRKRGEALQALRERPPHLVLIGAALGDEREGGFRLCADLRRLAPTMPILFLSSHSGEADRISALRLGADDCVTKDISVDYLLARIESLLERVQTLLAAERQKKEAGKGLGSLRIDPELCVAFWCGQPLNLTMVQFRILEAMVSAPGQVRHHTQLMRAARIVVEPNTVAAHIKAIRDRFRGIDPGFVAIRTERGAGYRWMGPA